MPPLDRKAAAKASRKSLRILSLKASEISSEKLKEIVAMLTSRKITFYLSGTTWETPHRYHYEIYSIHGKGKQGFPVCLNPPLCYAPDQTIIWDQDCNERLDMAIRSVTDIRIKGPKKGSHLQLSIYEGWAEVSDIRSISYVPIPSPHHLRIRAYINPG